MKIYLMLMLAFALPSVNAIQYTPLKKALLNDDAQYYGKPLPFPYFSQTGQIAFSVNDPKFCSPSVAYDVILSQRAPIKIQTAQGVKTVQPSVLDDNKTLNYTHKKGHARRINVGDSLKGILANYNRILLTLMQNGDPALNNRHFCVGFMDVYSPDAKSALDGVILFDPRIYQLLDEFDTNMHSQIMVEMHELAHQLQFINKIQVTRDPKTGETAVTDIIGQYLNNDKTVKRFELTADCMAGAMTYLLFPMEDNFAAGGLMMAGVAYGDFDVNAADHHGRPLERAVAVKRGINIAKAQPQQKWHSNQLVTACEAQVKNIAPLGVLVNRH